MDNVINLFSRRLTTEPAQQTRRGESNQESAAAATALQPSSFSDIAERNRVNQQRLKKEREQANKSVLKSYRIK
jgi:hypothetical protein